MSFKLLLLLFVIGAGNCDDGGGDDDANETGSVGNVAGAGIVELLKYSLGDDGPRP